MKMPESNVRTKQENRMCKFILSILLILMFFPVVAKSQCTQIFSALSFNSVQYPATAQHRYPPPVVSGSLALNIQFRQISETVVTPPSGVAIRYTLDNQPIGPVLTTTFNWQLDTTTVPDGAHALSVLFVNEPSNPCYTYTGRQYAFVVANQGVITGKQTVPIVAPVHASTTAVLPQYADFLVYPGTKPQHNSVPLPYTFIPPNGGVSEPTDFWLDPLAQNITNVGEITPSYWQLRNGSIVEDGLYSDTFLCDDLRVVKGAFVAKAPKWEQRKGHIDGGQENASLSSYSAFVPNLEGEGFYGLSIDGRLFFLDMDGTTQTLVGWNTDSATLAFHYLDDSIPISTVEQQTQSLIGTFDVPFNFPTDLAFDPNNHQHVYVADMENHRIALVDLSQSPPVVSTFAGTSGVAGYQNGARSTALFNQPSSIIIAAGGTMYIADAMNAVIRKIDSSGNVTTVVGLGPGAEPSSDTVAQSTSTYAPDGAVQFSSAYINFPNVIRFDSQGNIVLGETVTQTVRYINLGAQTVTTLARLTNTGNGFGEQIWLDVDRQGNVGLKDDIILSEVAAHANGLFRVPITGTSSVPPPSLTVSSTHPIYSGHTTASSLPWTSGPWGVAIADQEGRLVVSGVNSFEIASLRLLQSTDPAFQIKPADYAAGRNIWFTGTVPNFPFGSRPSFAALHGYEGYGALGNVNNFSDLASMTDAQLAAYLQAGAEGSVPRPELTGNDLRNLVYYIRRTTMGGASVQPGANSPDKTAPVISGIAAVEQDATDVNVSWTTNKQTLGVVLWGTTTGTYFGWSPIESSYTTTHAVKMSNLPAGQTIYFVVRSKDQAGNQTVSAEQNITLQ